MKTVKDKIVALIVLVAAGVLWCGCVAVVPPPPIHQVPADLEGVYMGNHSVAFNVTAPTPQIMAPQTEPGPIHVYNDSGRIRISLRLSSTGEPCHLWGIRQGATGRVNIESGQRCSIRMHYQGTLVLTGMQINQGYADFTGLNLRTDMSGPFVGEALVNGRRQSMQGNARISFSGTRQPSRSL